MVFTWRWRYSRIRVLASVSTSASPSGSRRKASLVNASPASTAIASAKSSRGPAAAPKWSTSTPASCSAMIVLLSRSASSRCTSTTSPKCSVRNPGTSRCIEMYSSNAASTMSHQCANSTVSDRVDSRDRYSSRLRSDSACTIARLSGKNWYTDPIATPARSASSVVVSASYPISSTNSAQASSIRCTRATLRPWTGTRRSGRVEACALTVRHSFAEPGALRPLASNLLKATSGADVRIGRCPAPDTRGSHMASHEWVNWAGNIRDTAPTVRPGSVDEVAEVVKRTRAEGRTVKPAGSGHSFTAAAQTDGVRLDLGRLAGVTAVDGNLVTVGAGTSIKELNRLLAARGLALPNLGDIDSQTIAGAISSGTHGTGGRPGCPPAFVEGLTPGDGTG